MKDLVLTNSGNMTNFIIHITKQEDYYINVNVFEVTSWLLDNTVHEKELYCSAYMKWDGCCHVYFGELDIEEEQDGYLHLCGVDAWKKHNSMMKALYKFAEDNIKEFDSDEKWEK